MRIGILADSHGHADVTALAAQALVRAGVEMFIHLGDIETEEVLDELTLRPARLVWGNCDWASVALTRYAEHLGITVDGVVGHLDVGPKRIVFTHGHLPGHMQAALDEEVDYLLHGHTHEPRDERVGATRVINPGALFRARRYTAVVLDPLADEVEFVEVTRPAARPVH